jgi:hypothetical protein
LGGIEGFLVNGAAAEVVEGAVEQDAAGQEADGAVLELGRAGAGGVAEEDEGGFFVGAGRGTNPR